MTEQRRIERELEKDMESVDEFDDNDILSVESKR